MDEIVYRWGSGCLFRPATRMAQVIGADGKLIERTLRPKAATLLHFLLENCFRKVTFTELYALLGYTGASYKDHDQVLHKHLKEVRSVVQEIEAPTSRTVGRKDDCRGLDKPKRDTAAIEAHPDIDLLARQLLPYMQQRFLNFDEQVKVEIANCVILRFEQELPAIIMRMFERLWSERVQVTALALSQIDPALRLLAEGRSLSEAARELSVTLGQLQQRLNRTIESEQTGTEHAV